MNWIKSSQFQFVQNPDRHYVFRRNNTGNTEIDVPKNITTKGRARMWLLAHPEAPTRFRRKKAAVNMSGVEIIKQNNGTVAIRKHLGLPGAYTYFTFPMKNPTQKNIETALKPVHISAFNSEKNTCGLRSHLKTFLQVGKGRQGIVFKATKGSETFAIKVVPHDLLAERRREKQPGIVEFDIQKAISDVVPRGVVMPYQLMHCMDFIKPAEINMKNVQDPKHFDKSKQTILTMQWCNGGTLGSRCKSGKVTDDFLFTGMMDILKTLAEIRKTYPDFRHNDLHIENVFLNNDQFLMGDFGWARLKKNGTNPAVNTANGTTTASFWGVGPKTDPRYDHHLFLNELREFVIKNPGKFPKTAKFLEKAVPKGYRGQTNGHVVNYRLIYDDPCPGLPDLKELMGLAPMRRMELKPSVSNLTEGKARLRKKPTRPFTSLNLVAARAKLGRKVGPKAIVKATELVKVLRKISKIREKRVTSANLQEARAKLKKPKKPKEKSPQGWRNVKVPVAMTKTAAFNKMITKFWTNNGKKSGANPNLPNYFQNAWNRAKAKALEVIKKNMALKGLAPSPVVAPLPVKVAPLIPRPPVAPLLKGKKYIEKPKERKAIVINAPTLARKSPSSGRVKILGASGRMVYADLLSIPDLQAFAARHKVDVKGARSKIEIIQKILSNKGK